MIVVSCRKKFLDEAAAKWGLVSAEAMRESLEKMAEAVEAVNSYPLKPEDEPSGDQR